MGSYASKLLSRYGAEMTDSPCAEEFRPSTPVDAKITLPTDPRSASVGIPRTPIEVNYTPPNTNKRAVTAIPLYLQKKPYLETDLDDIDLLTPKGSTPTSPPHIPPKTFDDNSPLTSINNTADDTRLNKLHYKVLGIDPRSPATDFDRTPILSLRSWQRIKARSQENLAQQDSSCELRISYQPRLSYCETLSDCGISEVQALPDILSDVNAVIDSDVITENSDHYDSCSSSSTASVETISDSGEEITVIRNPKIEQIQDPTRSNMISGLEPSIGKNMATEPIYCQENIQLEQQSSPPLTHNASHVLSIVTKSHNNPSVSTSERTIMIWKDSISPKISNTSDLDVPKNSESKPSDIKVISKEEIMIEFDDTETTRTPKSQQFNKQEGSYETRTRKKNLTERKKVCELDSKNFFQEKTFGSDGKNTNQVPKVRTPLGNRSNNHAKVNSMPMKSPQLLRTKPLSIKLHQENTPPRSMKSKLNGTQWDPDSTVLI